MFTKEIGLFVSQVFKELAPFNVDSIEFEMYVDGGSIKFEAEKK